MVNLYYNRIIFQVIDAISRTKEARFCDLLDDPRLDAIASNLHGEMPLPPTYVPTPEMSGLAIDATFYYVLCTVSLLLAAFGNLWLVRH